MTVPAQASGPHGPASGGGGVAPGASKALAVALFTVFLDILGFGIIIPIQPFYAESFGASEAVVTLIGASFSFMQFLFAPFWGRLSDRVGRRPIILSSIAFTIVGHALFASAGSLWMLLGARMLVGFGSANFGAAQAVIADTTTGANRARGMGLFGAAFGVGFIIGPAVGGTLGQISPEAPAWASAGLAVANLLFAFRFLPETHPPERRGLGSKGPWLPILELPRARLFPNAMRLLIATGIVITAQGLAEQVLSLMVERVWVLPAHGGISTTVGHKEAAGMTAICLIGVGLVAAIVQGGLLGRLQRKYGERRLVVVGSLIAAVGIGLYPVVAALGSFPLFVANGGIFAAGVGLMTPSLSGFLSRSVPNAEQGRWLGMAQSLGALGRTLGPAFSGLLFSVAHALPFVIASALMLVTFVVALRLGAVKDWGGSAHGA